MSSGTLTNNGTIQVITGTGWGQRQISADLVNNGTVNLNASTSLTKSSGVCTNAGTFSIASGQTLTISDAS